MTMWLVLYRKEMLELVRNFKWIWVPLVFILLGAMQPVTTYYMPQILDSAGNLPEGTVIKIPLPSGGEVLASTLRQYSTIGALVLVLSFMSVVSGERNSGTANLIFTRPISYISYITSKWAGMLTLTAASLAIGYAAAWFYTGQLVGHIAFSRFMWSLLVYGLWMLWIVTLTLLFSAVFRAPGAAAFLTLGMTTAVSIITGVWKRDLYWSPGTLSDHAAALLNNDAAGPHFGAALIATSICIAAMLAASIAICKRNKAAE